MLARLGVAGFRIDAAKHIQQVELDDILAIVDSTLTAEGRPVPYYFLEVSSGSGEALGPRDFFGEAYRSGGAADITEFTFVGVGDKFRHIGGQHISQLNPNGPPGSQFSPSAWGLMPSDKAVVFLQNHDTQHQCGLSYRDGNVFRIANVWMLAQPYGYPVRPVELCLRLSRRKLDGSALRCRRPHERRHLRVEPRDRGDRSVGVRAS